MGVGGGEGGIQPTRYQNMVKPPSLNQCTGGQTDPWNRMASPDSGEYGKLVCGWGATSSQWRKDRLLNKWCGENCIHHLESLPNFPNQDMFQWITDINVRNKTIQVLKKPWMN